MNTVFTKKEFGELAIIFLIILLALFFRRMDAFTNPQLWAEDGRIFLQQAQDLGVHSLFTPYAGYLHAFPRIVALFFKLLAIDLPYIPTCYNACAFLFTLFIGYYLWKCAKYLDLKNRILYATIIVLLPIGAEIFMNLTNTIWFAAIILVQFIFIGYKNGTVYSNVILVVILGLTGPFSLILSPVVILILIIERKKLTKDHVIPLVIFLLCGAIQLVSLKYNGGISRYNPAPPIHNHLIRFVTNNVGEQFFFNSDLFSTTSDYKKYIFSAILAIPILYFIIRSYLKITNTGKYVLTLAALLLIGSYIVATWPNEALNTATALGCPRYYFATYSCIAWILIICWDNDIKWPQICLYTFFILLHNEKEITIYPNKEWRTQLQEYDRSKRDTIFINPDNGWYYIPHKNHDKK